MNRRFNLGAPLWLALAALVCAAGMWTYADRVLIPYQKADADAHERPRGNLSDLYPRWLGARELLLHGRDPYSAEVTREIQIGFYGRPLDPSLPGEPRDEEGFAYPVYVVFCLAPTIGLPFAIVQKGFYWALLLLTCVGTLLWLRVLLRSAPLWTQISLLALTVGSPAVMQGLKLRQMSLLVAGLLAIAITLLTADHEVAAGVLLALASIKPQLVLLPLCWLAIWTMADWRRRYRLAVSFLVTMTILVAASEWYLPHWIPRFWRAIHEYQRYTGATSVMDNLIGAPWSWAFELLAFAAIMSVCWRERRQAANTGSFALTLGLVLAATVLMVPTSANYNQVLVIPALLVLAKERRTIWRRSIANRVLFVITTGLVFWPWISSVALAGLSFVLPQETVERAWAVPFWTVVQIPVGVAALMLVHYYQRTFTASAGPGTS
ncbi:MAG: glycosyltransferase family 87 protein [Terriglobales bacterium]